MDRAIHLARGARSLLRRGDDFGVVFRGASIFMLIRIAGLGLNLLTQMALARWMGAFEYGVFANARGWAYLLALPSGLGLSTALLRFAPEYLAHGDWPRLAGYLRFAQGLAGVASIGAALAGIGIVLALDALPRDQTIALVFGLAAVPALTLSEQFVQIGRSFGKIAVSYSLTFVAPPLLLVLPAGVLWLTGRPVDAMAVGLLFLLGQSAVLLAHLVNGRRIVPAEARGAARRYEAGAWIRVAMPLILFAGFVSLTTYLDVAMLRLYVAPDQVGIYDAAMKLSSMLSFAMVAVGSMAAPRFSFLHARGDRAALQALVIRILHLAFWPVVAGTAVLILAGDWILALFGPEFPRGHAALAILALSYVGWAAMAPAGYLLTMTGHQQKAFWPYVGALASKVALNALLMPVIGIEGAAAAQLVVILGLNLSMAVLVRRHVGLRTIIFATRT